MVKLALVYLVNMRVMYVCESHLIVLAQLKPEKLRRYNGNSPAEMQPSRSSFCRSKRKVWEYSSRLPCNAALAELSSTNLPCDVVSQHWQVGLPRSDSNAFLLFRVHGSPSVQS